jgi:HD-GYP domain-containing protein (c-di-GMP phosphodiesterase class II)
VKSPFTIGHSPAVARLAAAAAEVAGLSEDDRRDLEMAALLHDLGAVSVPNGIWDKAGPLNASEWERVRLHAYHTERVLARVPGLGRVAAIAGTHHERPDGTGYHRGVPSAALDPLGCLLAACDAYQAMTEDRAHRAGLRPQDAASALRAGVRAGQFDPDAARCVLSAVGQAGEAVRRSLPCGLSEREAEVLVHLARGCSNKEIGLRLTISAKTVQHHISHIYEKSGVSTRAAAALFASEHDLVPLARGAQGRR